MDFCVGGLAGVGAGFFSNPFDVLKVRLQLQGELQARGKHKVLYKNIAHAAYVIAKHDGILALQKGLVPALWFQLVVNGARLGIYQTADDFGFLRDEHHNTKLANSLLFGSMAGMAGGFLGSPLMLMKIQLQAQASKKIAVGTQHEIKGMLSGLISVYRKTGVRGLWRGGFVASLRNLFGTAAQIPTYSVTKEWMDAHHLFQQSRYLSTFVASNVSAVVKTLMLAPLDLITTRLYNQGVGAGGKGTLYSGLLDCAFKIIKTEGVFAFYKGIGPAYMRQAPHSVLTLLFWDILKDIEHSFLQTNTKPKEKK
ncbi:solute carrier family 25 member 35-like [Battus philenor]|uniref:solute carrier family 25 member 35-like n=1 Tax=Battus philenor TaxID=42288 RepID=UPI0035CFFB99